MVKQCNNIFLALFIWLSLSVCTQAENSETQSNSQTKVTVVNFPVAKDKSDTRHVYYLELLQLTLENTLHTHGTFRIQPVDISVTQGRAASEIAKAGEIDVFWTMTSAEREQQMLPIRIPLLKGLMGYRIALIRQGEQTKFHDIPSVEQLRRLSAGQGYDWPDTRILQANRFTVMASQESSLHAMLRVGRFDYFPRGIYELGGEVDYHSYLDVEKTLIFYYPAPMFFFVSYSRPELAERIHSGLIEIIDNGEFDRHFQSNIIDSGIIERFNIGQRRLVALDNPLLTEETRKLLRNEKLWLNVEQFCSLGATCLLPERNTD